MVSIEATWELVTRPSKPERHQWRLIGEPELPPHRAVMRSPHLQMYQQEPGILPSLDDNEADPPTLCFPKQYTTKLAKTDP